MWQKNRFVALLGAALVLPAVGQFLSQLLECDNLLIALSSPPIFFMWAAFRIRATSFTCASQGRRVMLVLQRSSPMQISDLRELGVGSLFIGSPWGLTGDLLSVSLVNLMGTALITYKAWSALHRISHCAKCKRSQIRI